VEVSLNAGSGSSPKQITLADVLITDQLQLRPARAPHLRQENAALHALARHLADDGETLLTTLTEVAVELCAPSGSAGVSLLETGADGEVFRWVALAGQLASHVGGTTPRDFSPCGACLDRNAPQLYMYPERLFTYFAAARPAIVEGLVLPFSVNGAALGTIWVVSHDEAKKFDREDVRIMAHLADFTAAAYRLHLEVTERKRAEAALQDLDRRKDRFLAVLAHEMRQPITAMLPALALMRSGASKDVGQHARAVIERQVDQLQHLVDDLIDLARFAEGKVTLHKKRLDLRNLAENTAASMSSLFEQHGQRFTMCVPNVPAETLADETRLQQVLSNLLTNASRYAGAGGEVSMAIEVSPESVNVRVRDNGTGISPETLPLVFEPFVQLDHERRGGLGIGLTVVKRLVSLHDGTVEARSAGIGRGAEFIVSLPAMPAEAA
jgi:signal transduction histidine kinase